MSTRPTTIAHAVILLMFTLAAASCNTSIKPEPEIKGLVVFAAASDVGLGTARVPLNIQMLDGTRFDDDAVVIADLPSNADAAALSLAVAASGMVDARVTVLLTPEEIDTVAATVADTVTYSPPGN